MHRTQLLLEDEQYLELRREARQAGRSMGDLARELIASGLKVRSSSRLEVADGLEALAGAFDDEDGVAAGHDRVLYGKG